LAFVAIPFLSKMPVGTAAAGRPPLGVRIVPVRVKAQSPATVSVEQLAAWAAGARPNSTHDMITVLVLTNNV
jgi:hypothetical protein